MAGTRVLIVEDEAIIAADLAGKLDMLGYEVVGTAASGEEAVELACRLCPQLVLMDICLKGAMDGINAAEAIHGRLDVPVIYLTAHSDAATLARSKLSEPFGYVLKPFEERELATAIEIALYKHQADRQLRRSHEEMELRVEKRTRELGQANMILNAINQIFHEALTCETEEALCKKSLATAEKLTGSRFGIIAELNPDGRLDTIALSDPGWSACRMPKTNAVLSLKNLQVRGILGSAVNKRGAAIINDPATCPERIGTPEGHPEITCFLGVPLQQSGETIGLIGLANKDGGYGPSDLEAVETMAMAIVEALMRKRAEVKLQELNRNLEKRVTERTAELETANRELEAFAYSVSHDLRSPLRSINGFSKVLKEDYGNRLDAEGKGFLDRIIAATWRMGQLIDDLLGLARITRADMRRAWVDLSDLVRKIANRLKEDQPERQVEFVIAEDLSIEGDEQLLTIMLENLIDNAWKFTEKVPHALIEFGTTRVDGSPAFFLRDNGAGFNMAYAEKLFNPFQRLHGTDEFAGAGIGLATVKRIVNRHGGRVWAEGETGRGATFYFTWEKLNEVKSNPSYRR